MADSRWMAVSPAIFAEAAPLVLSKPLLFVHTKLDFHENLASDFRELTERVFPEDFAWALKLAQSMVERLAITIRFLDFYKDPNYLHERLPNYVTNLSAFPGLKEVQISYGPQYISLSQETFQAYVDMNYLIHEKDFNVVREAILLVPFLANLREAVILLRAELPDTCRVKWCFDRAGMPGVPSYVKDRAKVVEHLEDVSTFMQRVWNGELDQM